MLETCSREVIMHNKYGLKGAQNWKIAGIEEKEHEVKFQCKIAFDMVCIVKLYSKTPNRSEYLTKGWVDQLMLMDIELNSVRCPVRTVQSTLKSMVSLFSLCSYTVLFSSLYQQVIMFFCIISIVIAKAKPSFRLVTIEILKKKRWKV